MIKRRGFSWDKVDRILVIALSKYGIGNTILLTPLLNSLKKGLPSNSHITLIVASKINAEVLRMCSCIDEIIVFEDVKKVTLWGGIAFFRKNVASKKFDLTITTFLEPDFYISLWCLFSRAPYRINFIKRIYKFLDTFSIDYDSNLHEVEIHLKLLHMLKFKIIDDEVFMSFTDKAKHFAEYFLKIHNVTNKDFILGIHPGANTSFVGEKRWAVEKFAKVADLFANRFRAKIIFFGGPDDVKLIENLQKITEIKHIYAADQSIGETAALIKKCNVFLSNDSGLMHVAAALKVPIITIFGPTIVSKNYPWKVKHRIVRKDLPCSPCYRFQHISCSHYNCLNLVEVEEVFRAIETMV